MPSYKQYTFQIILAEGDDPYSYAPGYPYINTYSENQQKAREEAERELDEGEKLGRRVGGGLYIKPSEWGMSLYVDEMNAKDGGLVASCHEDNLGDMIQWAREEFGEVLTEDDIREG